VKLRVLAVGKLGEAYWRAAADEYAKRLRRYASLDVVEVPDRDLGKGVGRAIEAEGADLLRATTPGSYVLALDTDGAQMSSEALARRLEALMLDGTSDITFVIGGSAGLAPDVCARADERLSLSAMTLPHQLCRVVLLEQLYRAFRIMRNEPYHR
jgi:23S rRNA (pseudouridine1915-N3)-methyltransferase